MSIKFYYAPMSNASRIHAALAELGVPYEEVRVDLKAGDQKKPEFLKLNPNGKVPTIVIDGTPMFESVAIQIALGERYGVERGLWPKIGSGEHLQALTWLVWSQATLVPAVMRYMNNSSEYVAKEQHNAAQAKVALEEVHRLLGILDQRLQGREYVAGGGFTLADLDVAAAIGWAQYAAGLDLGKYERLAAWLGRCQARPSARAELPE